MSERDEHERFDEPRRTVRVKALQGASRGLEVVPRDPERGAYLVASASQPGVFYAVDLEPGELSGRCTCAWGQHGGVNCKHVMAALREHYRGEGQQLSFWPTRDDARRQHRHIVDGAGMFGTTQGRRRRAS